MGSGSGGGGAPTGKWEGLKDHLTAENEDFNVSEFNARLIVQRPNLPVVEIALDKPEFLIGRVAHKVDLVLDDDLVSRQHAKLTANARGYFQLEDLNSANGIEFGGRTVRRLNLVDGDEFRIGKADFVFHATMDRFSGEIPAAAEPVPREDSIPEPPEPGSHAIEDETPELPDIESAEADADAEVEEEEEEEAPAADDGLGPPPGRE